MGEEPSTSAPPPEPPFAMEVILQGYKLYRLLLLVTYASFIGLGVWASVTPGLPEQSGPMGSVIAGIGLLFGAAALYSFWAPTKPWAWSYHAAMLCLGVPLCMTTPFALAVGWTWLHPGVRAHFGILPEPELDLDLDPDPPS